MSPARISAGMTEDRISQNKFFYRSLKYATTALSHILLQNYHTISSQSLSVNTVHTDKPLHIANSTQSVCPPSNPLAKAAIVED
jgi:hypothetical protein